MKYVITRNGFVKDVKIAPEQLIEFSLWDSRKRTLTPFGKQRFGYVLEKFKNNEIELCYTELGKGLTLIAVK